jgi:hypothetical protein
MEITMPTITLPNFTKLTVTMPNFTRPTVTMPNLPGLDISRLDLSKVRLPTFDRPTVDLPKIDLPDIDVDRLGGFVRDAAYAGVGLVALTIEKAAERGRGIQSEITLRARQLAEAIA